ncbi:MAG TPA: 16S rRNA (guanine(966)-N(2))-methyltransferase RsmD [Burkholderiaceae bacterium]|nr:16S rRNA (guanine(966)-N(2))-methyltransferase RsmD [Burkholderiaceae bacterium]
MRIIGGRWKRTPLPVIEAPGLRPSPDRVRETVFNWLAHFIPDFSSVCGLDLFAGTGVLGFELASRGAARVTLVERNPALEAQLQRTKQKLRADTVTIIRGDALAFARDGREQSFDVVFLDPPFDSGLLEPALQSAARLVSKEGWIYAESRVPLGVETAGASGLRIVRADRAGQVHFHLLQRA